MALVHPGKTPVARPERELHPLIGLAGGFGLIILAAVVVHAVFGMLL